MKEDLHEFDCSECQVALVFYGRLQIPQATLLKFTVIDGFLKSSYVISCHLMLYCSDTPKKFALILYISVTTTRTDAPFWRQARGRLVLWDQFPQPAGQDASPVYTT
jgi:hypothetical protein